MPALRGAVCACCSASVAVFMRGLACSGEAQKVHVPTARTGPTPAAVPVAYIRSRTGSKNTLLQVPVTVETLEPGPWIGKVHGKAASPGTKFGKWARHDLPVIHNFLETMFFCILHVNNNHLICCLVGGFKA